MATIYLTKMFIVDNYGRMSIPDGDITGLRFSHNGNISFAQGNTGDNSTSGFADGNREVTGSIDAMIRKGSPFSSFLLRQAEVDDPDYNCIFSFLGASSGIGNQLNLKRRVTLNGVIFDGEDYNFSNMNTAPGIQTYTWKAMKMLVDTV